MAANFWLSSHKKNWLFDKALVDRSYDADAKAFESRETVVRVRLYFVAFISGLAKELKLRNRIVVTAITIFKRFYLAHTMTEHDPRIVAPAALFVAAKNEESFVDSRALLAALQAQQSALSSPNDTSASILYEHLRVEDILCYEMLILTALDFNLVIYHPFRDLTQYVHDVGAAELLQTAWNIANDSYRTDLCLYKPPFLIAVACVYMACSFSGKDCGLWLERIKVHEADVIDVVKEILLLYDIFEKFEKAEPVLQVIKRCADKGLFGPAQKTSAAGPAGGDSTRDKATTPTQDPKAQADSSGPVPAVASSTKPTVEADTKPDDTVQDV